MHVELAEECRCRQQGERVRRRTTRRWAILGEIRITKTPQIYQHYLGVLICFSAVRP